jgi:AraC family transcriptional regulator
MNYLRQVQRAVDHIEDHLDDSLDLQAISAVAGVSHWHFQRMFRALTHESMKGYIRSRRLSRARVQLLETDRPVLDIALCAGFQSQASFTRAFRRQHGCAPGGCRASGAGVPVAKVRLNEAYVRHLRGRVSLEPTLRDEPAKHLVGVRTPLESMEAERNRLAHLLQPLWGSFVPRMGEVNGVSGCSYGVIRTHRADALEYVAAQEVRDVPTTLPDGMVHLVVPAATWAVFTHRGEVADLDHTVNYVYACWLLQSGREHAYGPDLELYDHRFAPGSPDSQVDYAIPLA